MIHERSRKAWAGIRGVGNKEKRFFSETEKQAL